MGNCCCTRKPSTDAQTYDSLLFADNQRYGALLQNTKEKDCSPILRNVGSCGKKLSTGHFADDDQKTLGTLWETFSHAAKKYPFRPCLGQRRRNHDNQLGDYVWMSYDEVLSEVCMLGCGLLTLNLRPKEDCVGILSVNRVEWDLTQLACFSQSMPVVALYSTLGIEAVKHIVGQTEMKVLFTEKVNLNLLRQLASANQIPSIKHIVQFDVRDSLNNKIDALDNQDVKAFSSVGIHLHGLSQIVEAGKQSILMVNDAKELTSSTTNSSSTSSLSSSSSSSSSSSQLSKTLDASSRSDLTKESKTQKPFQSDIKLPLHPPSPSDACYIMYTSGTTSTPKGAIILHSNIVSVLSLVYIFGDSKNIPGVGDVFLSFLPLAHIFEAAIQSFCYSSGTAIAFFSGDIKKMTDDLLASRPTIMIGVPRVFQRIIEKITQVVSTRSCLVRYLWNRAYGKQVQRLRAKQTVDESVDATYFEPIRSKVGLNRLKICVTGAAPMNPSNHEFMRVLLGSRETCAGLCLQTVDDFTVNNVGSVNTGAEVKLRDVPELGYFHSDEYPRGELLARGPLVFAGYYKNKEATDEAFLNGGWFATGDIARFNPNGTISIIDRKKNIFKLSQGEYIAVERVETEYAKCPLIQQIWVYGNSFKSTLMGVVVPNAEKIREYAIKQKWWPASSSSSSSSATTSSVSVGSPEYLNSFVCLFEGPHAKELKEYVLKSMATVERNLKGFEKVKDIIIEYHLDAALQGFSETNQLLTPTLKIKRHVALTKYSAQLRQLYTDNGEAPAKDEIWPGENTSKKTDPSAGNSSTSSSSSASSSINLSAVSSSCGVNVASSSSSSSCLPSISFLFSATSSFVEEHTTIKEKTSGIQVNVTIPRTTTTVTPSPLVQNINASNTITTLDQTKKSPPQHARIMSKA